MLFRKQALGGMLLFVWVSGAVAQDLAAPLAPRRLPPPAPVQPGTEVGGAAVAAARGRAAYRPGSEEALRYMAHDPADPFQRPPEEDRPVGIRLFTFAFW